jgi:hypothetical protein
MFTKLHFMNETTRYSSGMEKIVLKNAKEYALFACKSQEKRPLGKI